MIVWLLVTCAAGSLVPDAVIVEPFSRRRLWVRI